MKPERIASSLARPKARTGSTLARLDLDFPLIVPRTRGPYHRDLYRALRSAILAGRLAPGARLPASRALARQLGVARGTVVLAFEQLHGEGYLETRVGSGTRVSARLPESWFQAAATPPERAVNGTRRAAAPPLSHWARSLSPSPFPLGPAGKPRPFLAHLPDLAAFPHELWSRLAARRIRRGESGLLGSADVGGYLPLRSALAEHLRRARGVVCRAEQIVLTSSLQEILYLTARLVVEPGQPIWMEEPGYQGAHAAFRAAGAKLVPVEVDGEGLCVSQGIARAPSARLAYVTPAHQAPLGVTLSMERRLSLLEWAEAGRAYVLEDDYDSEFRYAGHPLPALQSLDRSGLVIHAGTFSKSLFPALRLSYVVLPDPLLTPFLQAKSIVSRFCPLLPQAVLLDFIEQGEFGRHLRRMRERYAERHAALSAALATELPAWTVQGAAAGLELSVHLPSGQDDRRVASLLAQHDILVQSLSEHCLRRKARPGLLLGFAAYSPRRLRQQVSVMRQAIEQQQDPAVRGRG
jgi:GntR family transcriptional regulator/MocR family aminotransferase